MGTPRKTKFILASLTALALGFCSQALASKTSPLPPVRLAIPPYPSYGLVLLALANGEFSRQGLKVIPVWSATGKESTEFLHKGEADMAAAYITPWVFAAAKGQSFSILTELHRSPEGTQIVYRKERLKKAGANLAGKKVGIAPGTNAEFLISLYLRAHALRQEQVTIVRLTQMEMFAALKDGSLDAAVLWEPYLSQFLVANPGRFDVAKSSFYVELAVLAANPNFIKMQPEAVRRFMMALARTQRVFVKNPKEARSKVNELLQKRGITVHDASWSKLEIQLGLSSLLRTMINIEGAWYSQQNKLLEKQHPVFPEEDSSSLFHDQFLQKVAPDMVTYR